MSIISSSAGLLCFGFPTIKTPSVSIMMDNELITWLLIAAGLAGFGGGAAWQTLRRRATATKTRRRRVERMAARAQKPVVPKADEAPKTAPVKFGVLRPVMFAYTTLQGSVTAADLFVQRAQEADEDFYRALPIDPKDLKSLQGLFASVCALEWEPGCGLSRHTYSLNFSNMINAALNSGFMPHPNATSNDLQLIALADGSVRLGTGSSLEDFGVGAFPHITELWMMCDPADKKHELDDLLEHELNVIRAAMPRTKLLVSALQGMLWQQHWDELFDLVRDVRRLGAEAGRAQDRSARTDALAKAMYAVNASIDERLATLTRNIRTPAEADTALTNAIPFMAERELSVLFLRTLAVIRVISGDNYIHGMHCSSHIRLNVEGFPDVHALLDKARHIAFDVLENGSHGMSATELQFAGNIKTDADKLAKAHNEVVERLWEDVERLQTEIDRFLILQGRPRRYAVRLNEANEVEALLVLEH